MSRLLAVPSLAGLFVLLIVWPPVGWMVGTGAAVGFAFGASAGPGLLDWWYGRR